MHNLIALSLGLPGTPLHGLNDFEPRSRPARRQQGCVPWAAARSPASRARRIVMPQTVPARR